MDELARVALFIIILFSVVIYFARFGFSHIYDVAFGRRGLDVVLFRKFVIGTIAYETIERAYRRWIFLSVDDSGGSLAFALPIANRVSIRPVIIRRNTGFFRYIALTPEQPALFLERLRSLIGKQSYGDSALN